MPLVATPPPTPAAEPWTLLHVAVYLACYLYAALAVSSVQGLYDHIKDEQATHKVPTAFNHLVILVIQIDIHLKECSKERSHP